MCQVNEKSLTNRTSYDIISFVTATITITRFYGC